MSRFIETMRFEHGRIHNFDYHLRRMNETSMAHFGDSLHWNPRHLLDTINVPAAGIYKIRLVYGFDSGTITMEPYTIRPICSLKLVYNNDIGYSFKYENRSAIERLVQLKEDCDDILIVKNGVVTDVSYANIAFKKDSAWYTPDSFLLNGIARQKLLDTGKISEQRIAVDNLKEFTHFKLINAMLLDEAPESEVLNIR